MEGLKLENGSIAAGAFDFDGNILKTPTTILFSNRETGRLEEFPGWYVDENPHLFSGDNRSYDFLDGSKESSLRHFRCVGGFSQRSFDGLYDDVKKSIEDGTLSDSFQAFKEIFFIKGRIWSLITARGNSPDNFERVFRLIREECLSVIEKEEQVEAIRRNYNLGPRISEQEVLQFYFKSIIHYICCDHMQTRRMIGLSDENGAIRKTQAMSWWISEIHKKLQETASSFGRYVDEVLSREAPIAIGFSDDSVSNIIEMGRFLSKYRQPKYKSRLYYTGNPDRYPHVNQELQGIGKSRVISQYGNTMLQVRIS